MVAEHRRGSERGAAAVELALVLPLLLLLIGGVVDLGRATFTKVIVTNAAREGARAAVFTTSTPGPVQRATTAASGIDPADLDIQVTQVCSSSPAPGDNAKVVVTRQNFDWIMLGPALSLFGAGSMLPDELSGSAVMKCGG